MTDIRIKRLYLENFKCHKNLRLDFDGGNASIYGDNATGKTSIYDALTWLLFGKDSQGNGEKNIEIKPLDASGEVRDHEALTAVEAVLLVNGEEVRLRRTYKEVWTTKRGSSEATYDGNTSEYYVDGVPCKKNGFQDKVNELVSEDTFRMLTSVSHFASGISWQDRRAVLFKVAGVMDDQQILATNEAFAPLVEGMGRLSLDDYKKKLLAEKKKFTGAKTEIPARISECEKTIEDIDGLDFAGAKAQVEKLQAKADGISAEMLAIRNSNAIAQKDVEIREAKLALQALENENQAYRASQSAGGVNVHSLNIRLTALNTQLDRKRKELVGEQAYISSLEQKIEASRKRWISVNGEAIAIGNTCPTCGQRLPADQVKKAMESEQAQKQKRLDEILQAANYYKETKAQAEDRLARQLEDIKQLEAEMADIRARIAAAEAAKVEPKDMEDYAQRRRVCQDVVEALSAELFALNNSSSAALDALQEQKIGIVGEIAQLRNIISKESLLEYSKDRVKQLREEARRAAECLEAIEKMLYLMDEYSRYKTRFVEDSINGLFRIAQFRLFREQANGGVEERCDVVHEGVPYISVNNGMKINLGIDIINTLSTAYGVKVPLFVDNAESVTNLEECGGQIIRLVVSRFDKELRVDYEN